MSELYGMFTGLGLLFLYIAIAYFVYLFANWYKILLESATRSLLVYDILLDKVCVKKGIDINKELVKRDYLKDKKNSIKQLIREEIVKEFEGGRK